MKTFIIRKNIPNISINKKATKKSQEGEILYD